MFRPATCVSQLGLPFQRPVASTADVYFLTAVESGKSRIKVPADSVPRFQKAAFLLTSHGRDKLTSLLGRMLILLDQGSTL